MFELKRLHKVFGRLLFGCKSNEFQTYCINISQPHHTIHRSTCNGGFTDDRVHGGIASRVAAEMACISAGFQVCPYKKYASLESKMRGPRKGQPHVSEQNMLYKFADEGMTDRADMRSGESL